MARPVGLDVDTGSDASSIKTDTSPPHEKKARFPSQQQRHLAEGDGGEGSEKENRGQNAIRHDGKPGGVTRAGSLHGKELKRQYSMSDATRAKADVDDGERRRAPAGERGRSTGRETSRSRAVSEQRGSERERDGAWRPEERAGRERPRSRAEHDGSGPGSGSVIGTSYPTDAVAEGRGDRHGPANRQNDRSQQYHPDNRQRTDLADRQRTDLTDRGRSRDGRLTENRRPPREPSPHVSGGGQGDDRVRAPSRERHSNREDLRRRDESRHR